MKKLRKRLSKDNQIHVKIGEVKVGHTGDVLKATLGSCVGIAFVWRRKGLFGLAHCLLPDAPETTFVISAKFVSQAVPSLMALLKVKPDDIKEIEVFYAGGGNMMSQLSKRNVDHIGLLNIAAAKKYLSANGFNYKELDVGGDVGRQIFVDCTSGDVFVNRFEKVV